MKISLMTLKRIFQGKCDVGYVFIHTYNIYYNMIVGVEFTMALAKYK